MKKCLFVLASGFLMALSAQSVAFAEEPTSSDAATTMDQVMDQVQLAQSTDSRSSSRTPRNGSTARRAPTDGLENFDSARLRKTPDNDKDPLPSNEDIQEDKAE